MLKKIIKWILPVWESHLYREGMTKVINEDIHPWNWQESPIKYDGLPCILIKRKGWFSK